MPADRLLSTLLRALQDYSPDQETPRIVGTAASLLTTLNNPLNVTLLVSHVSRGPALWTRPEGLRFCLSYMGIYHSAVQQIAQRDSAELARGQKHSLPVLTAQEPHLALRHWIPAVLSGLDDHSLQSSHVLALGGILNGLVRQDIEVVSPALRESVETSFARSVNRALADPAETNLGRQAIVLALNYSFPHLSDYIQSQLNYDELMPLMVNTLLHSDEALNSGKFLRDINADVKQLPGASVNWPVMSPSFSRLQSLTASPLITSIGPLSRLIAHAAASCHESWQVSAMVDDVAEFCKHIYAVWRTCPISAVDVADERVKIHSEARDKTLPEVWKLLRNVLFALTIMLRSAIGRLLADPALSRDNAAPHIAAQCLQSLRDLNFIFARVSSSAFSQWTFVHLASIDILGAYPTAALSFLKTISSSHLGTIPSHPLDRISDLYFLNTAEHFTLTLASADTEALLLNAAAPYLTSIPTPALVPIFEAAHSVMLAIFSAPQNADLTARQMPFYVQALFRAFPQNLSARQFRLAFRNLVRIVSPPGDMARQQPLLAAVLMDLVRERTERAGTTPLPGPVVEGEGKKTLPLSEQAELVSTIIDALPFVAVDVLEEWLPILPQVMLQVQDGAMRQACVDHLWETFVGGAMDPDRSLVCVEWWTTAGGREAVVKGHRPAEYVMSGALQPRAGARL